LNVVRFFEETSASPSPAAADTGQRRIEELERKIGQQQLELDFFRAALRQVREQRPKKGEPGGTASSR
jgi:transposase